MEKTTLGGGGGRWGGWVVSLPFVVFQCACGVGAGGSEGVAPGGGEGGEGQRRLQDAQDERAADRGERGGGAGNVRIGVGAPKCVLVLSLSVPLCTLASSCAPRQKSLKT